MSLVTRKPVFGFCDQVRLKPGCSAKQASLSLENLEISIGVLSKQRTTKALIRLRGCTGWSAPLLLAYDKQVFSWRGSYYIIWMIFLTETHLILKNKRVILYEYVTNVLTMNLSNKWNGNVYQNLSQLMRLWHLSHRRPVKAQLSLRIRTVSPEPSLFAHIKYGSKRRVWPKIRHLVPLDGRACAFEDWVYGGLKMP